ncbi:MAG: hypothetical protein IKT22_07705, partial [Prevotella sp.]|nr:hypothetical protein [Prevotella sp.]
VNKKILSPKKGKYPGPERCRIHVEWEKNDGSYHSTTHEAERNGLRLPVLPSVYVKLSKNSIFCPRRPMYYIINNVCGGRNAENTRFFSEAGAKVRLFSITTKFFQEKK